jgi:hypothetical protein
MINFNAISKCGDFGLVVRELKRGGYTVDCEPTLQGSKNAGFYCKAAWGHVASGLVSEEVALEYGKRHCATHGIEF